MAYRVLIAVQDAKIAGEAEASLRAADMDVVTVDSFEKAVERVSAAPPDLLITAIRLGPFNGLHLGFRARGIDPHLPVIVIGSETDSRSDVEQFGATFIPASDLQRELGHRAAELLEERQNQRQTRRWPRKAVNVSAVLSNTPVRVVEVSDGGMRLTLPAEVLSEHPILVTFPEWGITVNAFLRWSGPSAPDGQWTCGAYVPQNAVPSVHWKRIVETLN